MHRTPATAEQAISDAFRQEWGRVLAALIRRIGDWDLAEECAQEAFAEATRRWPTDGVPERPGAWLTTVASNRALDRLRRARRGSELLEQVARERSIAGAGPQASTDPSAAHAQLSSPSAEDEAMKDLLTDEPEIEDDRLRLMFTCCHPALGLEARVALTLRTLAGLSTAEIARAFLVPEATMGKRLTRAKAKIAAAGIPYRVPPAELLPERLGGVLAVLYLLFNEGYLASSGDDLIRHELCAEAIRLTRLLAELMPDESEVTGLLALMLFSHSRRDARTDAAGELLTLEDQDRSRWHHDEIAEGAALLDGAVRRAGPASGVYLLQAAIAACHASAASAQETDWSQIVALYALLLQSMDTPIVRLNYAVAVSLASDIDTALGVVDAIAASGELDEYYLLEAARADMLRRRGDADSLRRAADAYRRALELVSTEPERRFMNRRLAEVEARLALRPGG